MDTLVKANLIVVEGKDEKLFLEKLLDQMGLRGITDVRDVEGKDHFRTKIPALLKMTGFDENVKSLAIIRDADDNADAAFQSIQSIMRRAECEPPAVMNEFQEGGDRKVGIFIMPGDSERGMLEDLCLRTVSDHPAMKCVDSFVSCIQGLEQPPNEVHLSKVKVVAFLAAMPELAITNAVGRGAMKGFWNLDSPELDGLKKFLTLMETQKEDDGD